MKLGYSVIVLVVYSLARAMAEIVNVLSVSSACVPCVLPLDSQDVLITAILTISVSKFTSLADTCSFSLCVRDVVSSVVYHPPCYDLISPI